MKVGVVLLFVGGMVAAVSCQKPKTPCCGPKQLMTGIGGSVGEVPAGGAQGFYTYMYGAFDFTKREYGYYLVVTYPNGTYTTIRTIQKYAQGSQWIILDEYKYCLKQAAQKPEPTICIPDTAQYVMTGLLGGPGSSGISADTWTYDYSRSRGDPLEGMISVSVISEKCYPFSSAFIGSRFDGPTEVPLVASTGYMNMTLGIPEPDKWFTLPSYCTQQVKSSGKHWSLPDLDLFNIPRFF